MYNRRMSKQNILILGDLVAITIVTLIGFATHGETSLSFLPRMLTTLVPLAVSWFLVAPWLGLFDPQVTEETRFLWRPALAMLFAGPLAVLLRAILINTVVIPIFALVLSATSALGMLVWRGVWLFWNKRR
jgi:hypothetical protein